MANHSSDRESFSVLVSSTTNIERGEGMNNQEVAGWMNELADWFEGIAKSSSMTCTNELNFKRAQMWRDRAKQVESMTCDGCRWWDSYIADKTDGTACCDNNLSPIYEAGLPLGPKFGCNYWEAKPGKQTTTLPACASCEFNTKATPRVTQS
jgi:hypothetical protein